MVGEERANFNDQCIYPVQFSRLIRRGVKEVRWEYCIGSDVIAFLYFLEVDYLFDELLYSYELCLESQEPFSIRSPDPLVGSRLICYRR